MKKLNSLILLLVCTLGFAQIPAGYYNNATGTGYTLKTNLKTIISNGYITHSYDNLFTDPDAFEAADVDIFYENDGSILDIYSEKPTATDAYNYHYDSNDKCGNYNSEADCFNGEHVVPQSTYNSAGPMVGDLLQLLPTDGYVNNRRSNFPFANVSNPTWTSTNGSKVGNVVVGSYSGLAFEPIDEFKGDIARILFYFATRYQTQVDNWDSFEMFNGTENQAFTNAFLDILLTWHNNDPVSPKEIARNNAAYNYQGNRNPYVDHPEYIFSIWGAPLGVEELELANVSVYPNPSNNNKINIQTATILDEIQLINTNGQLVQDIKNPMLQNNIYTLENLPQGFYLLKLTSNNQSTTKKVIVN